MDKLTTAARSRNMAAVKSKDTKPELAVRRFLHCQGLRYGLHSKDLPGKPDLVFTRRKTVLFVHGCFWHGHENCKDFRIPKTRSEWWENKIGKNILRDKKNKKLLEIEGWLVLVIWECEINGINLKRLHSSIVSGKKFIPVAS